MGVAVISLLLGTGMLAGCAGRYLLARIPRGVRVPAPWCELATGLCWALAGFRYLMGGFALPWLIIPLVLAWFGVLLAAADFAQQRLPDVLTLSGVAVLGVTLWLANPSTIHRALCAGALFVLAHAAIRLLSATALGAGDVKLAATTGLVLGAISWPALIFGMLAASTFTTLLFLSGRWSKAGIPHGPGMLVAAWLGAIFPGFFSSVSG